MAVAGTGRRRAPKLALLFLATIGLAASAAGRVVAQGCGPTRLKVTEAVVIDRAPAAVWAAVGNFQDLGWNGDVAAAVGQGGNQPGVAQRRITLRDGSHRDESLFKYDGAAMSYSYHIDKLDAERVPVQNASATLDVVGLAENKSRLVWRSAFYRELRPDEGAPDQADAAASRAMAAVMRAALADAKAKLDPKS